MEAQADLIHQATVIPGCRHVLHTTTAGLLKIVRPSPGPTRVHTSGDLNHLQHSRVIPHPGRARVQTRVILPRDRVHQTRVIQLRDPAQGALPRQVPGPDHIGVLATLRLREVIHLQGALLPTVLRIIREAAADLTAAVVDPTVAGHPQAVVIRVVRPVVQGHLHQALHRAEDRLRSKDNII